MATIIQKDCSTEFILTSKPSPALNHCLSLEFTILPTEVYSSSFACTDDIILVSEVIGIQIGTISGALLESVSGTFTGKINQLGSVSVNLDDVAGTFSANILNQASLSAQLPDTVGLFSAVSVVPIDIDGVLSTFTEDAQGTFSVQLKRVGNILAVTESPVATFIGKNSPTGSLLVVTEPATASFSGELKLVGSVLINLEGAAASLSGRLSLSADVSATTEDVTAAFVGRTAIEANILGALEDAIASFSVLLPLLGDLNATLQSPVAVFSVQNIVQADLSATLESPTLLMDGAVSPQGIITSQLEDSIGAFIGQLKSIGTLNATLQDANGQFQAAVTPQGIITSQLEDSIGAFIGQLKSIGTLNATLQDANGEFVASTALQGAVLSALDPLQALFNGNMKVSGVLDATLPDLGATLEARIPISVRLLATLEEPIGVFSAEVPLVGTLASTLDNVSPLFSGNIYNQATVSATLATPIAVFAGDSKPTIPIVFGGLSTLELDSPALSNYRRTLELGFDVPATTYGTPLAYLTLLSYGDIPSDNLFGPVIFSYFNRTIAFPDIESENIGNNKLLDTTSFIEFTALLNSNEFGNIVNTNSNRVLAIPTALVDTQDVSQVNIFNLLSVIPMSPIPLNITGDSHFEGLDHTFKNSPPPLILGAFTDARLGFAHLIRQRAPIVSNFGEQLVIGGVDIQLFTRSIQINTIPAFRLAVMGVPQFIKTPSFQVIGDKFDVFGSSSILRNNDAYLNIISVGDSLRFSIPRFSDHLSFILQRTFTITPPTDPSDVRVSLFRFLFRDMGGIFPYNDTINTQTGRVTFYRTSNNITNINAVHETANNPILGVANVFNKNITLFGKGIDSGNIARGNPVVDILDQRQILEGFDQLRFIIPDFTVSLVNRTVKMRGDDSLLIGGFNVLYTGSFVLAIANISAGYIGAEGDDNDEEDKPELNRSIIRLRDTFLTFGIGAESILIGGFGTTGGQNLVKPKSIFAFDQLEALPFGIVSGGLNIIELGTIGDSLNINDAPLINGIGTINLDRDGAFQDDFSTPDDIYRPLSYSTGTSRSTIFRVYRHELVDMGVEYDDNFVTGSGSPPYRLSVIGSVISNVLETLLFDGAPVPSPSWHSFDEQGTTKFILATGAHSPPNDQIQPNPSEFGPTNIDNRNDTLIHIPPFPFDITLEFLGLDIEIGSLFIGNFDRALEFEGDIHTSLNCGNFNSQEEALAAAASGVPYRPNCGLWAVYNYPVLQVFGGTDDSDQGVALVTSFSRNTIFGGLHSLDIGVEGTNVAERMTVTNFDKAVQLRSANISWDKMGRVSFSQKQFNTDATLTFGGSDSADFGGAFYNYGSQSFQAIGVESRLVIGRQIITNCRIHNN
jgi:hypothetical protein